MPGFDFTGAVPVDAVAFLYAVIAFMAMPIIGAILVILAGMSLSTRLFVALKQLFDRRSGYSRPDLIGLYNDKFSTDRDTTYREELVREYRQRNPPAGDDGALAEAWERYPERDLLEGHRAWLEMATAEDPGEEGLDIESAHANYLRWNQRQRENNQAYEDGLDDRASETAV
jgi:hypothetical protein